MKRLPLLILSILSASLSFGQNIDKIINAQKVERIERVLSADDMQGRRTFTPGIEKAAAFITSEFEKIGLTKPEGSNSYLQSFSIVRPQIVSISSTVDGASFDSKNVIVATTQENLSVNDKSGFQVVTIGAGANLRTELRKYVNVKKNFLVLVDTSFTKMFPQMGGLKNNLNASNFSTVFMLTSNTPKNWSVVAKHTITEQKLANVVGVYHLFDITSSGDRKR